MNKNKEAGFKGFFILKTEGLLPFFILFFVKYFFLVFTLPYTQAQLFSEHNIDNPDVIIPLEGEYVVRHKRAVELVSNQFPDAVIVLPNLFYEPNIKYISEIKHKKKNIKIINLNGEAKSTLTDAKISYRYLKKHQYKKFIIVTDWYHAWRSWQIFNKVFDKSFTIGLLFSREKPDNLSIRDRQTMWAEYKKYLAFYFLFPIYDIFS